MSDTLNNLSLFDADGVQPIARLSDPETSHMAAVDAIDRATSHRQIALKALQNAGPEGLTDFDLEAVTGIKQTSIGKRRGDLVTLGYVERLIVDGVPQRRPAPSGSLAAVWVAL